MKKQYRVYVMGKVYDSYLIEATNLDEAEKLAAHEFAAYHEGVEAEDITAWEERKK